MLSSVLKTTSEQGGDPQGEEDQDPGKIFVSPGVSKRSCSCASRFELKELFSSPSPPLPSPGGDGEIGSVSLFSRSGSFHLARRFFIDDLLHSTSICRAVSSLYSRPPVREVARKRGFFSFSKVT